MDEPRETRSTVAVHVTHWPTRRGAAAWIAACLASTILRVCGATRVFATDGGDVPFQVDDMIAVSASLDRVTLTWTSPAVPSAAGPAAAYDLRYSVLPPDSAAWDSWPRATNLGPPKAPGNPETATIARLEAHQTYYFVLKSAQSAGALSAASNVVRVTTAPIERLTVSGTPQGANLPDWSPDGYSVLLTADWEVGGTTGVYMQSLRGEPTLRVASGAEEALSGRWSPDGGRVALLVRGTDNDGTYQDLAIVDAFDPRDPVVVTNKISEPVTHFAWSPDGDRLAVVVQTQEPPDPVSSIFVLTPVSGECKLLGEYGDVRGVDWSPGGESLVMASNRAGQYDIWVVSLDGRPAWQVTNDAAMDVGPAWSLDGASIAFSSNRSGNFDIWRTTEDGSEATQLTFSPANEGEQRWSPDGSRLVFTSYEPLISDVWVLYLE